MSAVMHNKTVVRQLLSCSERQGTLDFMDQEGKPVAGPESPIIPEEGKGDPKTALLTIQNDRYRSGKTLSLSSYIHMKIKVKPARNKQADSLPLVRHAINGIEEKKGSEIACLNLKKISNSPCDYFVICEGNSRTHVQAIAGNVEDIIKKETGTRPWHVEGLQNAEWVLMDYVDVVVHVFQPHIRQHFGLENMWADADIKDMKAIPVSSKKKKNIPKTKTKKATTRKSVSTKKPIKKIAKKQK